MVCSASFEKSTHLVFDERPMPKIALFQGVNESSRHKKARTNMNCLPFLGHEKWEAFFMRVDLRVKHDIEARKAAIGLFELGHGYKSAAIALSLPVEAVRRWQEIYRAFGSEVLLRMDGKQGRYTYEQKVAAASAVVDGGMTKTEAMAAFGIMSMSPLKKWCALYRRGGAEALRPRPKGRPKGSKARPRTREEELEERCRRLEAEVAYLKKLRLSNGIVGNSLMFSKNRSVF